MVHSISMPVMKVTTVAVAEILAMDICRAKIFTAPAALKVIRRAVIAAHGTNLRLFFFYLLAHIKILLFVLISLIFRSYLTTQN